MHTYMHILFLESSNNDLSQKKFGTHGENDDDNVCALITRIVNYENFYNNVINFFSVNSFKISEN